MKHIARKITVFLLSAIVLTTMLPSYAHAVEWHEVPFGITQSVSIDGNLYVCVGGSVQLGAPTPSELYYLKLSCTEDATEAYYGTQQVMVGGYPILIATSGCPLELMHEDSEMPVAIARYVIFPSPIVDVGKHYTVQLVKTTDGGLSYTSVGSASASTEIVAPLEPPVVPEHPYWWSCYTKIKELGESNDPQTLVYEEGTALPIEIMQALQECPNVTLIFKCRYNDTDYEFTIPGDQAIVISDIPWYGPLWLNQHYSKKRHLVVSGDTLSKIAATYHTTVDSLLAKNSFIRDKDKIYVGQMIDY